MTKTGPDLTLTILCQIDHEKLARVANFNTVSGAQKQWSLTRAKLNITSRPATTKNNSEDAGETTPKATTTPKRKRTIKAGDEVGKPPGSTAKKGRTKKETAEEDEDFVVDDTPGSAVRAYWKGEGEGEGDECPASPTPAPKKRGRPSKKKASGNGPVVVNKVEESEGPSNQQQDEATKPTEPTDATNPIENNEEEF